MKPKRKPPKRPTPAKKKTISTEPLQNLRGSNPNGSVPPRKQPFVNHGLEESPVEARARFHSELLDRVREENPSGTPSSRSKKKDLHETIDVWEESLWSGVDENPKL